MDRMTTDQIEAYEERAGILEFDAGMSREDAERMAALAVGFEIVNHVKRRRLERAARLGIIADDEEAEFTMGED